MNIQEAKTEICNTLRAYLAKDENGYYTYPLIRQRPLLLIGPPGIGKTAIMEQAAAECGVGLVAYTITHHTRQSAIGLPEIVKRNYGGKGMMVTDYTMSEIVASVYRAVSWHGKGYGKVNGVSLKGWNGLKLDDISIAIISLIRAGAVFRFVYCMVRLQGAEEEQAQYRKRAKNTVLFYIVAESIWQIKDIVMYYYG